MIKVYYVDAFTNKAFKGNPAAVCVTESALDDNTMQNVANELNLSETAFVHCLSKSQNLYNIRWFTPKTEVNLCGHATLAATHILFTEKYIKTDAVNFYASKDAFKLQAKKSSMGITLNFPVDVLIEPDEDLKDKLLSALKLPPSSPIYQGKLTKQVLIEVKNEQILRNLQPNFAELLKINYNLTGVAITANSLTYDFVSRFFDPWEGINEDPVTGSAHTALGPYWSKKLSKNTLNAKQISSRGGKLKLKLNGQRILITGEAITTLIGEIIV